MNDIELLSFITLLTTGDTPTAAQWKGIYDVGGEQILKQGRSDGDGGTRGGTYAFQDVQCDRIFRKFFGTDNPFEALEGEARNPSRVALDRTGCH
jgi:DnaJ-class molecular chaperone